MNQLPKNQIFSQLIYISEGSNQAVSTEGNFFGKSKNGIEN